VTAALITAGGVVTWIFISDGVRDVSFSLVGRLQPLFLENVRKIHPQPQCVGPRHFSGSLGSVV
jgi:hypothetical protein